MREAERRTITSPSAERTLGMSRRREQEVKSFRRLPDVR